MSKIFDAARNIEFVGRTDQGGRADGIQCMVHRGHAFVSHVFSGGVSVIDVRDPRDPRPVNFLPTHERSWSVHVQTANDLLLVIEEFNFYSVYVKETDYYSHSIEGVHSSKFGKRGEDFSAGMRVYDISNPAHPRAIGFMGVEGLGLHRIWWTGDRYAYASALLDGYSDHIFMVIDMQDPTHPREVSRWALPGMHTAGGETMNLPGRVALHHAVIAGDTAYALLEGRGAHPPRHFRQGSAPAHLPHQLVATLRRRHAHRLATGRPRPLHRGRRGRPRHRRGADEIHLGGRHPGTAEPRDDSDPSDPERPGLRRQRRSFRAA